MAELWFPVPPLAGDVVLLRPWSEATACFPAARGRRHSPQAALQGSSARRRLARNAWWKVPLRQGKVNLLFLNFIASFKRPA